MGLIRCIDCQKEFSDRIDNCPHCGCPKDACVKGEIMDDETEKTSYIVNNDEEKIDKFKMPSLRKSVTIIVLLLLLCLSQTMHPYIQEKEFADLYDYAFVFGMIDLALLCAIEMIVPLIMGLIMKQLSIKHIKILAVSYGFIVFEINIILNILKITEYHIGWIYIFIFYFINKHILLQIHNNTTPVKIRICRIVAGISIVLLIIVAALGLDYQRGVINKINGYETNKKNTIQDENASHHCRYVEYDRKDATCTEDGYVKHRCNSCKKEVYAIDEATGHLYDESGKCLKCGKIINYLEPEE